MSNKRTSRTDASSNEDAADRSQALDTALAVSRPPKKDVSEYTPNEIVDLFHRVDADKPSQEAINDLRNLLSKHPELWKVGGDMAALAVDKVIRDIESQRSVRESIKAGFEAIQKDLGGMQATPLEKLLIENVVVCWLRMYTAELQFSNGMRGSVTLSQGMYWERRLSMTQDRYLKAVEALARVRRLLKVVPVQVNIATNGGQQVNVAELGR